MMILRFNNKMPLFSLLVLHLLLLSGCGQPQGPVFESPEAPLVWPGPPQTARVRYVGEISTEEDLKKQVSFGQGLKNLIFGKEEIGVLVNPYAVTKDRQERLFVADTNSGVIQMFDLAKREHLIFAEIDGDQSLITPVALTTIGNNVYVADSRLKKICVFDKKGRFQFSFGQEQLKRPTGLAYNPSLDKLYVSDTTKHAIYVFDKEGIYLNTIGRRGRKAGTFNFPTHLCFDKNKLYVSDTLNYRIQILSADGDYIDSFGKHGDSPGCFAHPSGIAVDSFGNIYVADRKFENIQIFNPQGRILMAVGREGTKPGQFWLPGGIFIDDENKIYVADSYNKRVQVFELIEETLQSQGL